MAGKANRAASIKKAIETLPKSKRGKLKGFASKIAANAPDEDLAAVGPEALGAMLQSAATVFHAYKGRTKLTVKPLGSDYTLVEVITPDKPFIVDSILGELTARNLEVSLVIHPVLETGDGKKVSIFQALTGPVSKEGIPRLKDGLKTVLDSLDRVVGDWQPMLKEIGGIIAHFRATPPPMPANVIAEAVQFLEWLADGNFTFMGLRSYRFEKGAKKKELTTDGKIALGILTDPDAVVMTRAGRPVVITPEIRDFLTGPDPLFIAKANLRSIVHRRTHLDYVGVKRYTREGEMIGELRIVGLFTSSAYTKSVLSIPFLRHKANTLLEASKADRGGHSGKALLNVMETWPRDEFFQASIDVLQEHTALAVQLEERPRIRALVRRDKFDRFVSVMIYVPRERYDSDARKKIGEALAELFDGYVSAWYPNFLENSLTRVQFIIGRKGGKTPDVPRARIEEIIADIVRTWHDKLASLAGENQEIAEPLPAFPLAYQEEYSAERGLSDAGLLNELKTEQDIVAEFALPESTLGEIRQSRLRLFHLGSPVALSRRVPFLESMGFRVIEERTFEIEHKAGEAACVFLHDMLIEDVPSFECDNDDLKKRLTDGTQAVWHEKAGNDPFNGLILKAGFDWKEAAVFRAYAAYLRQLRSRFTPNSMARALAQYPDITALLLSYFKTRFDPGMKSREKKAASLRKKVLEKLDDVSSSDDDRILRNQLRVIRASLRTNFYQDAVWSSEKPFENAPAPVLAFKTDPAKIPIAPKPVPYREIFVSSPRVEGLHLRFGPVARGGLRWSDRAQDYRTEVLGLVKAQQVKNAVIVPVGSKGGFYPKQLDASMDRNAYFEEGKASYKVFISSLLSLTDNIDGTKIVPPPDTVRHDGDDPYFVVAADKGTATFSDTANGISRAYDFWLDDAFASGGSAGYDHKKMGITARGGWEAVKRHFREMDRDIQSQPFTAVGIGDMSGDVFGNGMLLSECTRLIAAFDHRDIFIDPDPNPKTSFEERKRVFELGRSSWQDYDKRKISGGGGVFSRSAKTIDLPEGSAAAIGIKPGKHPPADIMKAILKAGADLLWFGGIGTYIRASGESNTDVGDRANDSIRITAKEVGAKVIGEGANLGMTQKARIEYNRQSGRCNSDAIDNSAGVNSSDVEVNIKIAFSSAIRDGRLILPARDKLLVKMTEEVAELVLRNNYLQTLAISLSTLRGAEEFSHQQRLIQDLEARDKLDRAVEDLPDDTAIAERIADGEILTRAETGVLLAYAKIVAFDDLLQTSVPDDPYLEEDLFNYFPSGMRKRYAKDIKNHRLRREIITTVLVNAMVNRGGPTFISRLQNQTQAGIGAIARAFMAARDSFSVRHLNSEIDALDTIIPGDLQLELYSTLQERLIAQTLWFLRRPGKIDNIGERVEHYRKAIGQLSPKLQSLAPEFLLERIAADQARFETQCVPVKTAQALAQMPVAGLIPDIVVVSDESGVTLDKASKIFFAVTDEFRIGRMVQATRDLATSDYFDSLALDHALKTIHAARRDITLAALASKSGDFAGWMDSKGAAIGRTESQINTMLEHGALTISRLSVAANLLAELARK